MNIDGGQKAFCFWVAQGKLTRWGTRMAGDSAKQPISTGMLLVCCLLCLAKEDQWIVSSAHGAGEKCSRGKAWPPLADCREADGHETCASHQERRQEILWSSNCCWLAQINGKDELSRVQVNIQMNLLLTEERVLAFNATLAWPAARWQILPRADEVSHSSRWFERWGCTYPQSQKPMGSGELACWSQRDRPIPQFPIIHGYWVSGSLDL